MASLRPITPHLWRALPDAEKARFLRHLCPYWEVHRHRMAPELWTSLQDLIANGSLVVTAARLTSIEAAEGTMRVAIRRRDRASPDVLEVATVISCTGPESAVRRLHDPLIGDLLSRGLATCDSSGLGIRVDDAYRVSGSGGNPSSALTDRPATQGRVLGSDRGTGAPRSCRASGRTVGYRSVSWGP